MENNMSGILVLGDGYLGGQYRKNGYTVWGRERWEFDSDDVEGSMDKLFTEFVVSDYHTIINCIGTADTRRCEDPKHWDQVYSVNAELPRHLSKRCNDHGIKFVHISTGCVYDQNHMPQREDAFLSSHCRYVVSKLAGEFNCSEGDLILRPRLYFSGDENSGNLLTKIKNFKYFLTDINSYTSTQTIVEASLALIENDCSGVFNVAQKGYINLVEIAEHIGLEITGTLTSDQLKLQEGLHLVNNIMDTTKLEEYYTPRHILDEISYCWYHMNPENSK